MVRMAFLVVSIFISSFSLISAQPSTDVQCGDIIEGEFQRNNESLYYDITIGAGDAVTIAGNVLGETLTFAISIFGPNGDRVSNSDAALQIGTVTALTNLNVRGEPSTSGEVVGSIQVGQSAPYFSISPGTGWYQVQLPNGVQGWVSPATVQVSSATTSTVLATDSPYVETPILSARGEYQIVVTNYTGIGVYTLYIGCTLRDGTVIEPGDVIEDEQEVEIDPDAVDEAVEAIDGASTFSGVGFPGIAPVDFTSAARLPLILATPMAGAITPNGGEIIGYTLDASAGDALQLDFARLSGNLNLGLVVLYGENTVVFQASLVTSSSLATLLTLPESGTYTIGVFRIDLLPPATPEATAFQVTATVNP